MIHISLRKKEFWRLVFPPLAGLGVLVIIFFSLLLPSFKTSLIAQKKQTIRELTRSAAHILEYFENKEQKGELIREEAQRQAKEEIRALRYGPDNKDYFWINDLRPFMVMHPFRPELEGKSIADFRDSHGAPLFLNFVRATEKNGSGYVIYPWQWKDDATRIVPKLSYVQRFAPWQWIIGTGIYLEDVDKEISLITRQLTILFVLIFAAVVLGSGYAVRQGLREAQHKRRAQEALQNHLDQLETTVTQRTRELTETNALLQEEVAEKQAAETALQAQKDFLQDVIESLPNPFYVIDCETYAIVMANKAATNGKNWVGQACHAVTHASATPCDMAGCACLMAEVKKTHRPAVAEHVHTNASGGKQYVEVHGYPILDRDGNVRQMIEYVVDISAKKEAAEKLAGKHHELEQAHDHLKQTQSQMLQQEKMASIGVLAAGVAHEINNPTGFIISNLGTLNKYFDRLRTFIAEQDSALGATGLGNEALAERRRAIKLDHLLADGPELIKETLDGAERIKEIVQNLKSFSRLQAEGEQAADINECLESTIKIVWNELKYKVTLTKELGELPLTMCRAQELNQVFMNLLVNAAQAIEEQGLVTVKTWEEDGWINITIQDTGRGIAPADLTKIFDPFFTTKEIGKGTGLGLSISYDIIKKHQGAISVTSELGKGTTFLVRLPVKKP